jgi:hypothetical protein
MIRVTWQKNALTVIRNFLECICVRGRGKMTDEFLENVTKTCPYHGKEFEREHLDENASKKVQ